MMSINCRCFLWSFFFFVDKSISFSNENSHKSRSLFSSVRLCFREAAVLFCGCGLAVPPSASHCVLCLKQLTPSLPMLDFSTVSFLTLIQYSRLFNGAPVSKCSICCSMCYSNYLLIESERCFGDVHCLEFFCQMPHAVL